MAALRMCVKYILRRQGRGRGEGKDGGLRLPGTPGPYFMIVSKFENMIFINPF
jgi:hypothetical protein